MYHIFILVALIAGENQINQAKSYIYKENKINSPSSSGQSEKKIEDVKLAQQNTISPKSGEGQDVVQQLKVEIAEQDKEINKVAQKDLESLGLDIVDQNQKKEDIKEAKIEEPKAGAKIEEPKIETKAEELKTEVKSEAEIVKILPKTKEEAVVIELDSKPNELEEGKGILGKIKSKILDPFTNKKDAKEEEHKNSEDSKGKIKNQNEQITVGDDKQDEIVKPTAAQIKKAKKLQKEQERLARKKAVDEERERQKLAKLKKLREEYLIKLDDDSGVEQEIMIDDIEYEKLSRIIIPRKKISPKFVEHNIPPPLLNRYRTQDNKYHPPIMSYKERIDFMFLAIDKNNIEDFNSLFATVDNPNLHNATGDTMLTYAIIKRRYSIIANLLSKGADPDLPNDLNYTPLNIAIELADYESTYLLISMGANAKFIDSLGRSYLMQAARVGSLPIVDLLISKGVEIDLEDNNHTTALDIAYKYRKDVIAKYLIKNRAKNWIPKEYKKEKPSIILELQNRWK